MGGFFSLGGGFNLIVLFVKLVFAVVFALILMTAVKGVIQWKKNNDSPVLTVAAKVAAKRGHTTHSVHNDGAMMHNSASTAYYATFETPDGARTEFHVRSREYGLLAEG